MIVADRKPLDEILESIKDYKKIMLMGCGGCVTICFSGGSKAVELLASQIKLARKKQDRPIEIIECTPERQCEYEFIDEFKEQLESVEAVEADVIAVGCPLCHANLDGRQPQINEKFNTDFSIPIMYFTELMGLAFGIKPKELGLFKHLTEVDDFLKERALI